MSSKSSRNAVTHGIHTSVIVLRNENNEVFLNLEAEHLAEERRLQKAQPLPDQQNKTILQNEQDNAPRPETRQ